MRLDVKNVAHGLLFCVFLCKMNRPMAGWGASQPQFPVDLSAERASRPSLARHGSVRPRPSWIQLYQGHRVMKLLVCSNNLTCHHI